MSIRPRRKADKILDRKKKELKDPKGKKGVRKRFFNLFLHRGRVSITDYATSKNISPFDSVISHRVT